VFTVATWLMRSSRTVAARICDAFDGDRDRVLDVSCVPRPDVLSTVRTKHFTGARRGDDCWRRSHGQPHRAGLVSAGRAGGPATGALVFRVGAVVGAGCVAAAGSGVAAARDAGPVRDERVTCRATGLIDHRRIDHRVQSGSEDASTIKVSTRHSLRSRPLILCRTEVVHATYDPLWIYGGACARPPPKDANSP
jgi:hypothetical protein